MTRQIVPRDEQETIITIDYETKVLNIYTNRFTVAKRIMAKGYRPVKSYKQDGEIIALEFTVPTKNIGSF